MKQLMIKKDHSLSIILMVTFTRFCVAETVVLHFSWKQINIPKQTKSDIKLKWNDVDDLANYDFCAFRSFWNHKQKYPTLLSFSILHKQVWKIQLSESCTKSFTINK